MVIRFASATEKLRLGSLISKTLGTVQNSAGILGADMQIGVNSKHLLENGAKRTNF